MFIRLSIKWFRIGSIYVRELDVVAIPIIFIVKQANVFWVRTSRVVSIRCFSTKQKEESNDHFQGDGYFYQGYGDFYKADLYQGDGDLYQGAKVTSIKVTVIST